MSTHNIRFRAEIRTILFGYSLLPVAMALVKKKYLECIFYFCTKTCYEYSLEELCRGTSNEYPQQHVFSCRDKKIY